MSAWKSFEDVWAVEDCEANEINGLRDAEADWQTHWQLSAVPHSSCVESRHAADQTSLSQQTLDDWVNWSNTHSLSNPGPSYPNSAGKQGEEIEFPHSKTGLQIPINRSLESLQSIKFHLPRWSGQSGSSLHTQCVGTHENMCKHVRMRAEKMTLTHALKLRT